MQKNYLQFLLFALVATGMVMIAGIRNDVNSLQSQIALTGQSLVSKAPLAVSEQTASRVASTKYSISDIENTIKRLGWSKQVDGSYSSGPSSSDLNYVCPTCQGTGSGCCVVNGVGSPSSDPNGCWGSFGTTNYQGICSIARTVSGLNSAPSTLKTNSQTNSSAGGSVVERPKSCVRSETCPQGQICRNQICIPCTPEMNQAGLCANRPVPPTLNTTLRIGTVSDEVTTLQKMLISLGYLSSAPSGNFMSKTEEAVKKFQGNYGISPVSGIVGELTRAKLNSMCSVDSITKVVVCSQ